MHYYYYYKSSCLAITQNRKKNFQEQCDPLKESTHIWPYRAAIVWIVMKNYFSYISDLMHFWFECWQHLYNMQSGLICSI